MRKAWDDIVGAAGLLGATAALAWAASAWFALPAHQRDAPPAGHPPAARQHAAMSMQALQPGAGGTLQAADAVAAADPLRGCAFDPILPPSSAQDGLYRLDAAVLRDARPRPFVAVAGEALRQHRLRDAEVALIAACRLAARTHPARSVPLADIQARLGQLYAESGARPDPGLPAGEALERGRALLGESVTVMTAVLGAQASRTRVAARRLALAEAAAAGADGAGGVTGDPVVIETAVALQAPSAQEEAVAADAPGHGCDAGAGRLARLVCGSDELAQLDSDLARLRAQARAVTRDPDGFARRAERAVAQRESCADAACLQRWYQERRRQLIAEFRP